MAVEGSAGHGGMETLERELQCAICTDILYQPLTLLDCLHTFCGSCMKEWFSWQATSASSNRRSTAPYTCPSCRELVRGTKADWRLTTLLEGYLKANPDKAKTEPEKEEMRKHYRPGDDVLPPVRHDREDGDSEDERLLAEVREMSMANVDPETARRRAERAARHRRRQDDGSSHHTPEEAARRQQPSQWVSQQARLTESRLRQHDAGEPHVEHQPSLRSLLSASDVESHDGQTEILQSIYAELLLDGIDVDNLTPEQEEELSERIVEAYRRKKRHRDRSRHQERRHPEDRSPQAAVAGVETTSQHVRAELSSSSQQSRSRQPIPRPHIFEQNSLDAPRGHGRSPSSTSQRSNRSATGPDSSGPAAAAARSATDLSQQPSSEHTHREARRRLSSTGRSVTDPEGGSMREHIHRLRAQSGSVRAGQDVPRSQSPSSRTAEITRRQTGPTGNAPASAQNSTPPDVATQQAVRSMASTAAFAPETVNSDLIPQHAPSVKCNRCEKPEIQYDLHYNCPWCLSGAFNLCFRCYRDGQGCNHWFGFGFRAYDRWYRLAPPEGYPVGYGRPHVLSPRRYIKAGPGVQQPGRPSREAGTIPQEGPFCESCLSFANDCYWYCNICLEGAWGYCDNCAKQGKHCTHPLLGVAHISTLQQPHYDPTKSSLVGLPHLRQDSFLTLPVRTDCDICRRPIPPNSTRYHCYKCSNGDYDVCNECYRGLVAQGKVSQADGPHGWRRCLNGHRMAVIGYQDTAEGGHLRMTVREPVGGWAFREDEISLSSQIPQGGLLPDGGVGMRCLALYNYLPKEGVADELAFPKNAEIREAENRNNDWFVGVYAGQVKLFPSNHVKIL